MGTAVLGIAAMTRTKVAAQSGSGCQPTQHFTTQISTTIFGQCSRQDIQINEVFRQTIQACPNADGTVTYKIHRYSHGTGQSYDPNSGQLTGTKYIIDDQQHERYTVGMTGVGCQPQLDIYTFRQELISQGSAPNEQMVVHETFSLDSSCNLTFNYTFDGDCHG